MDINKRLINSIEALSGGIGCDYVSGTGAFVARLGAIKTFVSNADGTKISNIKAIIPPDNTITSYTGSTARSYLAETELNDGKIIVFDNLVKEVTLSAGSGFVYYQNL